MELAQEERELKRGLAWNASSLVILGLSGFAMLAAIERLFGGEVLGRFQLVWGAYVILSQLGVGGLDRSVLRAVAEARGNRSRVAALAWGALLPAVCLALLVGALFALAAQPFAAAMGSPDVATGVLVAAPGLVFFSVNKVLLGVVNGLGRMRAFACYQALRYLLMPASVVAMHGLGWEGAWVPALFSLTEGALLLVLAGEFSATVGRPEPGVQREMGPHLRFGLRSVLAGVILELNTRLDVLMLGYFLTSDGPVGIYSLAVAVAEGVFQLVVVMQNNYNPILARHLAARRHAELASVVAVGKRRAWTALLAVGVVSVALFPLGAELLMGGPGYRDAWLPYAILMGSICLAAGWLPFGQILLMGNRPGWHTLLMTGVLGMNFLGNALLIPHLGLAGAAVGTGLAFLVSAALTVLLSRKALGFKL